MGEAQDRRFVVVLGAARSGTSLLRDLTAAHPFVVAVPFDVNHIWRIGNEGRVDDALPASSGTPDIAARIRDRLTKIARKEAGAVWPQTRFVAEKTVGNAMRPEFVDKVLPGAFYVRIVRDPRATIASTIQAWKAPSDTGHLMRKLRLFGPSDVGYIGRYALNALKGRLGHSRGLQIWGARYPGIDDDLETESLETICARQWLASVRSIDRFFEALPAERGISVSYEELVESPAELSRIWAFLGIGDDTRAVEVHTSRVVQPSGSRAVLPADLDARTRGDVEALIASYGYV